MSAATKKIITRLQADFFATMNALTKKQLEDSMTYLGQQYYTEGVSLISDENYDRLRETLIRKFGDSKVLAAVGAEVTKAKVDLPFFLGSMDKIKPDKNNLEGWRAKYKGDVCVSDKLDGISGLVVKSKGVVKLYTRGNGTVGQDICHMLPFISIGDFPGIDTYAVRGELIVTKAKYAKVAEGRGGARQMVSGLAGLKTLTAERRALMGLIDFVAYEVIVPEALTPVQQFTLLDSKSTFTVARWHKEKEVTIEHLSEVLAAHKKASPYEIDGIIVNHNAVYPRSTGRNPEFAFAFKMSFAEQQATTEVLQVIWEPSKDGYLKPTVNFEPVNIGGVVIQYATGFNAAFIQAQGLGPGAYIEIERRGDVIPYIKAVKAPSPTGPAMPAAKWHWSDTHVDAVLDDIGANPDVQKRALLYFAQTLEIGYCGEGNIAKLYEVGVRTPLDMLKVKPAALEGHGFAKAGAAKIVDEIDKAAKKATLTQWAVGSGIFGRGIGTKRVEAAIEVLPKDLKPSAALVGRVMEQGGWSKESAEGFVGNLGEFRKFLAAAGVEVREAVAEAKKPAAKPVGAKMAGQVVLFTGFHPKDLEEAVVAQGGQLVEAWAKKVTVLVVKDATVSNEKTKKAAAAGIPVVTAEQFKERLGL
uniref:DNA ligase (NAD(+)) n=1 Tax=viral metagenome TaxID=1070528 RepID=A0A6C0DT05_9ZZZZ